jgi:riboflavin kinase/FMN adenylyltransferase
MLKFTTTTVHGHGRGRGLGFPTINMVVPEIVPLKLQQGVYAARATVAGEHYGGALYYGPASTFGETKPALEVYLLDTAGFHIGEKETVEIEVVKFIRPVMKFDLPELLIVQMSQDEEDIRDVLKM